MQTSTEDEFQSEIKLHEKSEIDVNLDEKDA